MGGMEYGTLSFSIRFNAVRCHRGKKTINIFVDIFIARNKSNATSIFVSLQNFSNCLFVWIFAYPCRHEFYLENSVFCFMKISPEHGPPLFSQIVYFLCSILFVLRYQEISLEKSKLKTRLDLCKRLLLVFLYINFAQILIYVINKINFCPF